MTNYISTILLLVASSWFVMVQASVLQLTEANWNEMTAGRSVFIKFFAPWCGHCKQMAPAWEKLYEEWKDHKVGLVAEVDCTAPESEALCEEHGVEGFPTIMYGDPSGLEPYDGQRTYESLSEFAKEYISKPVCSVKNIDICDADVKTIIQDISKKSVEELKAIVESVDKQIESAQSKFEEEVEKMQKEYEAMTEKLTKGNDAIREETNYKWVQQVLGTMDGGDKKSAMEDEL